MPPLQSLSAKPNLLIRTQILPAVSHRIRIQGNNPTLKSTKKQNINHTHCDDRALCLKLSKLSVSEAVPIVGGVVANQTCHIYTGSEGGRKELRNTAPALSTWLHQCFRQMTMQLLSVRNGPRLPFPVAVSKSYWTIRNNHDRMVKLQLIYLDGTEHVISRLFCCSVWSAPQETFPHC